jgi:glucose-1-phosphate adenylyltransferase
VDKVLTIIMAGGEGTRLSVLANRRAKPAVPFGGVYRIIDFPLSNVMHSGGRYLGVITQYRPYSLGDHIGLGEWWGFAGYGRKAKILSPHTGDKDSSFYLNTADAVYRNIEFLERFPDVTEVLILSGDHIYKMDYRPMLEAHRKRGGVLTLATQEVPWEETGRFGVMVCGADQRITQFQEKPNKDPLSNKASLGIYVFNRRGLVEALLEDQAREDSEHDFGRDLIPRLIATAEVYNYDFSGYWRDVGTIRSYMETSMEALDPESGLRLHDWDVRTNYHELAPYLQHAACLGPHAAVRHALVGRGCRIEGEVEDSILSPGVRVGRGARVRRSILLHEVVVGENCQLDDVIIDKCGCVGDGCRLGDPALGADANRIFPHLLADGTTVIGTRARVGAGLRMGRNGLVYPHVCVDDRQGREVPAGTTFFPAGS